MAPIVLFIAPTWNPVEYNLILSAAVLYGQVFMLNFTLFTMHAVARILPNSHLKANLFLAAGISSVIIALLTYSVLWAFYIRNVRYSETSRFTILYAITFIFVFFANTITEAQCFLMSRYVRRKLRGQGNKNSVWQVVMKEMEYQKSKSGAIDWSCSVSWTSL